MFPVDLRRGAFKHLFLSGRCFGSAEVGMSPPFAESCNELQLFTVIHNFCSRRRPAAEPSGVFRTNRAEVRK